MTDKFVFWHRDYLVQTVFGQPDIGKVARPSHFLGKFTFDGIGNLPVTEDEDSRLADGFDTLAEARRYLEGIAKRLGYTLVSRKAGWAAYMASCK